MGGEIACDEAKDTRYRRGLVMTAERRCKYCNNVLVRGKGERAQPWGLRRHCNKFCKSRLAHQLAYDRVRLRLIARAAAGTEPDFSPHEIMPRDGGPMPRVDRALLERSMTGCSADW